MITKENNMSVIPTYGLYNPVRPCLVSMVETYKTYWHLLLLHRLLMNFHLWCNVSGNLIDHLWHLRYKMFCEIINGFIWFDENISNFVVSNVAAYSQTLFGNRAFTGAVTIKSVYHISKWLILEKKMNYYLLGKCSSYNQHPVKIYC